MFRMKLFAGFATAFLIVSCVNPAKAALSYTIGGTWDTTDRSNAAAAALTAVCARVNAYGYVGDYNVYAYYSSGIPTAQSSYLGSIGYGGTYPNERVTEHELCHYLGSGTYSAWGGLMIEGRWNGVNATALMQQFFGIGSRLCGDTIHFWPYGLNYDTESADIDRDVAMLFAIRADMGLTATVYKSTATTVSLTASDLMGYSAFNSAPCWSDGHFAHSGASYFTGNYGIRTVASTYSFKFAGDSLTLNNSGDLTGGGLLFKGVGTSAVITFDNLILDGGSIRQISSNGTADLFQLAGNLTVKSASYICALNGNINVLADLHGTANLTIQSATNNVTLVSSNNDFTGNINVLGKFALARNANMKFAIGANGVNNAVSGASATAVALNGVFDLDTTNASSAIGDSWKLVNAANVTYGNTFGVDGFSKFNGIWHDYLNGLTYSESTNALTVVAKSATVTWGGDSSTSLSGNANWSVAPTSGDALIFGAAGTSGATLNDDVMTTSSFAVSGLTFTSAASAYTITPGTTGANGFSLAGAITNSSTNLQTINDDISLLRGAPNSRTIQTTAGGGDITIGGNVSGLGGISKEGLGTLTLSGSNSYTGDTVVNAGTLSLSGTLSSVSAVKINVGSTFLLTGRLSSSSALTINGGTFIYSNPSVTTQTISGLTVGGGASTISNTVSGGTLALGAITRTVGGAVTFTESGGVTTTSANVNGILGAWAFVGTGANTLYACNSGGTIAGYSGATAEAGTASFGGIPSGDTSTVNYRVTSSGAWAVMGYTRNVNTINYAGAGAAVQYSNSNTTLTVNGLLNTGTGTLTIGGSTYNLFVVIGSGLDLVAATMTSDIVINNSIEDNASGYGSPSALTKVGSGKLVLNGRNTYSGVTTIGAGTLQLGSGSSGASLASAAVKNYGSLIFNHSDSITYSGVISGTGSMTKSGVGTLTLTGENTYTGSTVIGAGTLQIGNGLKFVSFASVGVKNSGTMIFNLGDSLDYSGAISGAGALTKTGTGKLTLSGSNSYTGLTTVGTGTMQIGNGTDDTSFASSVKNSASLVFNLGNSLTYSRTISGTGTLTKMGTGKLTLSGTNTYTGATAINAGTLLLSSGATIAGTTFTNDGALVLSSDSAVTADTITGSGTTTVTGTTVLTVACLVQDTLILGGSGEPSAADATSSTVSASGVSAEAVPEPMTLVLLVAAATVGAFVASRRR